MTIIPKQRKYKYFFVIFILALLVLRVPLITKGHMHFPDEIRYRYAFGVIDKFSEKDYSGAFSDFFRSYNRPSFILLSIPLACMQRVMDPDIGKDLSKPDKEDLRTYFIPSLFNCFASIMLVLLLYRFVLLFTSSKWIAFLAAVCYSFLNTSYLEIRHILPYYFSQCVFFFIILKIFQYGEKIELSNKQLSLYGFFAGVGFTYYPAYYYLPVFIIMAIFFLSRRKIKSTFVFCCAFLSVPIFYEIMSKFTVLPYFVDGEKIDAMYKALPISYEAASFMLSFWIVKYMLGLEGVVGVIILFLALVHIFKSFLKKGYPKRLKVLYIGLIANYIFVLLMIFLTGKMGIRAKYYYPYVFVFLIAAFLCLNEIKRYKKIFVLAFTGICAVSFLFFYNRYLRVVYPRDIRQFVREYYNEPSVVYIAPTDPKEEQKMKKKMISIYQPRFVGINTKFEGSARSVAFEDLENKEPIISLHHTNDVYSPYGARIFSGSGRHGKMSIYNMWDEDNS